MPLSSAGVPTVVTKWRGFTNHRGGRTFHRAGASGKVAVLVHSVEDFRALDRASAKR